MQITREDYIWNETPLVDMRSGHLFNTLKMLYNHLARLTGLPEIWFTKEYNLFYELWMENPQEMIDVMKVMIEEMEVRIHDNRISSGKLYGFEMIRISLTGELINKINKEVKKLKGDNTTYEQITG